MPQKFNSSIPVSGGWSSGLTENYPKLNAITIAAFKLAAHDLQAAWGKGGSQGTKAVKQWDKQFRLLTADILDLHYDDKLEKEAKETALPACAAILAMEEIPHWEDGHVEDIRNIREHLEPSGYWDDYPEIEGDDDDQLP